MGIINESRNDEGARKEVYLRKRDDTNAVAENSSICGVITLVHEASIGCSITSNRAEFDWMEKTHVPRSTSPLRWERFRIWLLFERTHKS